MKRTPASTPFTLPVLLSFNELAWILIFAMGLLCVHALKPKVKPKEKEQPPPASLGGQTTDDWRPLLEQTRRSNDVLRAQIEQSSRQMNALSEQLNLKKQQIERLTEELAKANASSTLTAANQVREIARLKVELGKAKETAAFLAKNLEDLRTSLHAKETELTRERQQRQALEARLAGFRGSVSPKLLGLKGNMTNVAILLDCSASMNTKTPDKTGNRWDAALATVNNWLLFLPVRRCVLITFSDRCLAFPAEGLMSLTGADEEAKRMNLIAPLQGLMPEGNTDTLSALRAAYNYQGTNQVDTIILFTDGAPNPPGAERAGLNAFSRQMMTDVLALCARHPGVPVNTIAIGDYYKRKEFTEFLMELSERTGGVFLGK